MKNSSTAAPKTRTPKAAIRYPEKDGTVILTPKLNTFFATGIALRLGKANNILGTLTGGGLTFTGENIGLPNHSRWALHFGDKVTKIPPGTYELKVFADSDPSATLDTVTNITVKKPPELDAGLSRYAVITGLPSNGDPGCSDYFFAIGDISSPDINISLATMKRADRPNAVDLISSLTPIVDSGSWFAEWDPLDEAGNPYTLAVYGDHGGAFITTGLMLGGDNC